MDEIGQLFAVGTLAYCTGVFVQLLAFKLFPQLDQNNNSIQNLVTVVMFFVYFCVWDYLERKY